MPSRRTVLASCTTIGLSGCLGSVRDSNIDCSSPVSGEWTRFESGRSRNGLAESRVTEGNKVTNIDTGIPFTAPPLVNGDTAILVGLDKISTQNLSTGAEKWTFELSSEDRLRTCPAVGCGHAFVSGTRSLYAVDLESGELTWSSNVGGSLEPTRSPLFGDGWLTLINNGVTAVDGKTGETLWNWELTGQPAGLAKSGRLFVSVAERGPESKRGLFCLDPANGDILWSNEQVGSVRQPPVVRDGTVAVTNEVGVVSVLDSSTGDIVTRLIAPGGSGNQHPIPVLTDERVFVVDRVRTETTVRSFSYDGTQNWSVQTVDSRHPPLVTPTRVMVTGNGTKIQWLNRSTGKVLHTISGVPKQNIARQFGPTISENRVLFPQSGGRISTLSE